MNDINIFFSFCIIFSDIDIVISIICDYRNISQTSEKINTNTLSVHFNTTNIQLVTIVMDFSRPRLMSSGNECFYKITQSVFIIYWEVYIIIRP